MRVYPRAHTASRQGDAHHHGNGESHPTPWQDELSRSVTTLEDLARRLPVDPGPLRDVITRYPMRITPYFLSHIRRPQDPFWRQAVPHPAELEDPGAEEDPLGEQVQSPVPHCVHRYPDRVLLLVSARCAVHCRHCMRKRKVGRPLDVTDDTVGQGIEYIRDRTQIREVILSGGDPLLLGDESLARILAEIRRISHIETIRIHTRVPCTLPQRVTGELVRAIGKDQPLYINIQFNHPDEITPESEAACRALAAAGIPLGCQTVLLAGVNDDPGCMERLMRALVKIRVRPYYIHHPDPVRGTGHFRVSLGKGLRIMEALRGTVSGTCLPHYMLDLPGGGGKVPLLPQYILGRRDGHLLVRNYQGRVFRYREK